MTIRAHRHFETTVATVDTCRRCGRPVLFGLAEGQAVRTDPLPLTADGEAQALTAGRLTFTLARAGLVYRDQSRRTDPRLSTPVVAEHDCPRRNL